MVLAHTIPVSHRALSQSGQVRGDRLRVSQRRDATIQIIRNNKQDIVGFFSEADRGLRRNPTPRRAWTRLLIPELIISSNLHPEAGDLQWEFSSPAVGSKFLESERSGSIVSLVDHCY